MIFKHDDLILIRKAILASLKMATMINIPDKDYQRLMQLIDDIDHELETKANGTTAVEL